MEQYLNATFTAAQIGQELNDPNVRYYLATIAEKPVGYLKLNFSAAQTEFQDKQALEIERIYTTKAYLGTGVGQLLINKAISVAKEARLQYVWLGVWEKNARAIRFYEKQGFVQFGSHSFMLGQDKQTDILMRLETVG
jgi:ribosomal protein S18 acetylase RimI-like enzyme